MARTSPWMERSEEDDDVEYVTCPICQGQARGCRYCVGHGDVHPDDVDTILRAYEDERRKKMTVMGVIIGVTILLLVILIVMLILSSRRKKAEEADGKPDSGKAGLVQPQAPPNPAANLPPWMQGVTDLRVDMVVAMKNKDYARAVQLGESAVAKCQDPALRQRLQVQVDEAKARLVVK
jgi:hypothetical protein